MSRFKVKVCGNNDVNNFKALAVLNLDYVGFIFYDKSKRFISNEQIFSVQQNFKKVGVFVNDSIETILNKLIDFKLDIIQLHGDETPDFCKELVNEIENTFSKKIEVWKAIGIINKFNFNELTSYEQCVNSFVFDTKTEAYGGSGKKFNWDLLTNYTLSTPFLLSGGIRIDDANKLKNFQHPRCLGFDINSGFELEPGIKNIEEIKQFIDIINR